MISVSLVNLLGLLNGELTTSLYFMDLVELVRECAYLIRRGSISIDGVVTVIRIKGGHASTGVMMVIVGEFGSV